MAVAETILPGQNTGEGRGKGVLVLQLEQHKHVSEECAMLQVIRVLTHCGWGCALHLRQEQRTACQCVSPGGAAILILQRKKTAVRLNKRTMACCGKRCYADAAACVFSCYLATSNRRHRIFQDG